MTFKKLRITGPDGVPYRLGQPMCFHHANVLLGTLDSVRVRNAGTEVHFASFAPTQALRNEPRHLGRLIFLEACAIVCERFHQIQAIHFSFALPDNHLTGPVPKSPARPELMERIGAVDVQIAPRTPGHLISGKWFYSERNHLALQLALEQERAIYRKAPPAVEPTRKTVLVTALRRFVVWKKSR